MKHCLKCEGKIQVHGFACSHDCMFCQNCAEEMEDVCPNCGETLYKCVLYSKALLVIDVQEAFNDSCWGERNNLHAEANINKLLKAWRNKGHMVMVKHVSEKLNSLFYRGSKGQQLKATIDRCTNDFQIEKRVNSSFIQTNLEGMLRRHGVTTVVVTGLTTAHCVSTTARMSQNLGFCTIVVSDATATFELTGYDNQLYDAETVHKHSLVALHQEFAEVMTTNALLLKIGDG